SLGDRFSDITRSPVCHNGFPRLDQTGVSDIAGQESGHHLNI
ncbi:MAG: hypothetical protein ACI8Y6_001206, partial [Brevundimonas sp.]